MATLDRASARPGSLSAEVTARLAEVRVAIEQRDRTFKEAFGLDMSRDLLRQDLARLVLIAFGNGTAPPLGHYQAMCAGLAAPSTVTREMQRFVEAGAVLMDVDLVDRRTRTVLPTQRLVDWACANVKLSNK